MCNNCCNRVLMLFLLMVCVFSSAAQKNTFGWNLVLAETKYKVIMPEGISFYSSQENKTKIELKDFSNFEIGIGEPILVIDNYKGGVLAFDPLGRLIFIESKETLLSVSEYEFLTVGIVSEDINLINGTILQKNRYILIIDQSFEKNTYKIILNKGETLEVPMSKVQLLRNTISNYIEAGQLKDAKH